MLAGEEGLGGECTWLRLHSGLRWPLEEPNRFGPGSQSGEEGGPGAQLLYDTRSELDRRYPGTDREKES